MKKKNDKLLILVIVLCFIYIASKAAFAILEINNVKPTQKQSVSSR